MFERFASRDGSFGTALTVATMDQVHFVARPFTKAAENHFVKGDVLLGRHFPAAFVYSVLPNFLAGIPFESQPRIRLYGRTGLFSQCPTYCAPGIFFFDLAWLWVSIAIDPDPVAHGTAQEFTEFEIIADFFVVAQLGKETVLLFLFTSLARLVNDEGDDVVIDVFLWPLDRPLLLGDDEEENKEDAGLSELELLKQQEIPSGYDAELYKVERIEIAARDGTMVPVSIVSRRDRQMGGPLHLYAYGAYGYAVPPGFSTSRLSLVDRGMAYAIAHIRGGDDLGRKWYLQGKLNERTNTFNDFVDVAKGLVAKGYTEKGRISISGGSAGGELMGAVVNTDPELWGAVVAHVPFVDVLSTMLDGELPLTPGEWPEWGNPILSKQAFAYILSYSPYDQVTAQDYPPMLVTAGLNDPRVTYWEPAKWVAKLREVKTGDSELLLKTNMGAGHGGKSGRFQSIYETAEEVAFILWQMGEAE